MTMDYQCAKCRKPMTAVAYHQRRNCQQVDYLCDKCGFRDYDYTEIKTTTTGVGSILSAVVAEVKPHKSNAEQYPQTDRIREYRRMWIRAHRKAAKK